GIERRTMMAHLDEIVEWAGLEGFVGTKLKHLSSGMKTRLAFSALRYLDREICLLDEVMTAADKDFRRKCEEVVDRYEQTGRTILATTHDREFAERFCNRALWLEDGRVKWCGDAPAILDAYFGAREPQPASEGAPQRVDGR